MTLFVRALDRAFLTPLALAQVELEPEDYDWDVLGGPKTARIRTHGNATELWELIEWLRCPIEILDENLEAVWWGFVKEIEIQIGAITIGVSLDGMANKVAVAYSYVEPGSNTTGSRATTAWVLDDESVATYGIKEQLGTLSQATHELATATRDTALNTLKFPIPIVRQGDDDGLSVILHCAGWFETLDWQYYQQSSGLEQHDGQQDTGHPIGLAFSTTGYRFNAAERTLQTVDDRLREFKADGKIVISGTLLNNGTFTIEQGTNADPISYTGTTLYFQGGGIWDTAKGFVGIKAGDLIQITGSVANSGYYVVQYNTNDELLGLGVVMTSEAAGAAITVKRGQTITLVEAVQHEQAPGNTATITAWGTSANQSFQLDGSTAWTVARIGVKIKRVGEPTDGVTVQLYTGTTQPTTLIQQGTINGLDISDGFDWLSAEFPNDYELQPGTRYWIKVFRSGSSHHANYYQVAVDEALGYADGSLLIYNGSAYVSRSPDADLSFRVGGMWTTSRQIEEMVEVAGQFFTGVEVVDENGILSPQYRDGDTTALTEITNLLSAGTSTNGRMLARVTRQRVLQLYAEPVSGTNDYFIATDGQLFDSWGVPARLHTCPNGVWCRLKDIIPVTANVSRLANPSPFFIERTHYDVKNHKITLEPRGSRSPWDIGEVSIG